MDTNNLGSNQGTESNMDTSDWRGLLQPESRHRIVNKIMVTIEGRLPVSGQEGLKELWNIAQRFEERIFSTSTSQNDYLQRISLKMLTMDSKYSRGTMANNISSTQVGPSSKPPDSAKNIPPPPVYSLATLHEELRLLRASVDDIRAGQEEARAERKEILSILRSLHPSQ